MKRLEAGVLSVCACALLLSACERPPMESTQIGYRGLGMVQVTNPRLVEEQLEATQPPPPLPPVEAAGPLARDVYQNVQVLGDLTVPEFTRLMLAITQWVAPPDQSCTYCHEADNLASEAVYTKIVSRRMIQMTRDINANWGRHVGETGVTCYTCHAGEEVPQYVWFSAPDRAISPVGLGAKAGQNAPAPAVGWASLPYDPLSPLLKTPDDISVISTTALPVNNRTSTKQTELTYALMMHISESLGVNCVYCHNSRSFADWDSSTPPRVIAWHGVRMAQHLNSTYIEPLAPIVPNTRLGPYGDIAKVGCGTCHQGLARPLNGVSMLQHYPELAGPAPTASPAD